MKNFTKDGNQYKLKPQWGINVPLIGAFVILTIVGFTKTPESSFKWWMLGIGIILVISSVIRSFLVIDLTKREIRAKMGLFASPKKIPLDRLRGFTVHQKKQHGLITINVMLIANYLNDKGREKEVALTQSFFTRPIQQIMNDIDEILVNEYQK